MLKKYHPGNENGSIEAAQEINAEYDRLFSIISQQNKSGSNHTYDDKAENEAFKAVMNIGNY